VENETGVEPV